MRSVLKYSILVLSASALLQSCFTGVESTPKITDSDVRRERLTVTPEMEFLSDVRPEPFAGWLPGKPFFVTDNKIGIIFSGSVSDDDRPAAGDTILWIRSSGAVSVTGDSVADLVFARKGYDNELVYRVNASPSALSRRGSVEIPFTIDLSAVEAASGRLDGRKLFILTPLWYDKDEKAVGGRRFVKVTVNSVAAGNHVYPLKVMFTADDGQERCVFLSLAGSENSAMRNFATVFSFTDPHRRYPSVTDANWRLIQQSKVALGMTRDECRLALGPPAELDRRPATAGVVEVWNYDDGQYLIFQDGLLTRFRR